MNLLLTSLFNLRRHRTAHRRVCLLLDDATGIDATEFFRCTRPWSSWLTVTGTTGVDRRSVVSALATPAFRQSEIVVVVSGDGIITTATRAACAEAGKIFVDAALPPANSRELALLQEVLHHDFELGGLNDWTGADPQFSSPVLRSLSVTHCRTSFPGYATLHADALWQQNEGQPLHALDIGCGAISRLRWGALNGFFTVTGVDPLLDMYAIVRERHGYATLPAIRCAHEIIGGAEQLTTKVAPGSFDLAFCSNALDHTEDPVAVVDAIARAVRPGGFVAIDVYTREGSRENWWQLHQFDMYIDDREQFVCETRDGVVRPLLSPTCGLIVREIAARDQTTAVILERVNDAQMRMAG